MMSGMEDVGAEIREEAAERIRDEEATGEEQVANSPRERKLELVVTVLLSVSALLSAWCAYQSTRLGSQESQYNNKSSVLQLQAFRAEEKTTLETLADLSAFERWLAATSAGDVPRARFIEAQFSPRLAAAFGPWIAQDPLTNPDAPASPLDTAKYERPDVDAAAQFERRSAAADIAASKAGEAADNFVLAVVLLAAALFLLGIQTRIGIFELRLAMSGIAGLLVAGTTIWVLTLPTSVAF